MTTAELHPVSTSGAIRLARDIVLLLARVGLGIVMITHAKMEYDLGGSLAGVGTMFGKSGVPLASVAGPVNVLGELIGGVFLIAGFAVPVVGVLMALNMTGAWIFVHTGGLMSSDGTGPELVIALGLLSLVLAMIGSGRFGLDALILPRVLRDRPTRP